MIFITADVLNSVCFGSSAHKFSLARMASEAQKTTSQNGIFTSLWLVSSPVKCNVCCIPTAITDALKNHRRFYSYFILVVFLTV